MRLRPKTEAISDEADMSIVDIVAIVENVFLTSSG